MLTDESSSQVAASNIAASFTRAAQTYRRHADVQRALAAWVGAWLPINRTGRAIELGAGPGIFTEWLLPWSDEFVATDVSPEMCAIGRAVVPQASWRTMAAEAPTDGPWDWIFTSSMLQWVHAPADVFAACRSQLAPGGKILGGLFVSGSLPELGELAPEIGPVRWRTAESWRAMIELGGLKLVRDEVCTHVQEYASALAFWRSLHGVGAAPERRLSSGALRRLLRLYQLHFGGAHGTRATWMFYRFEAERAR